MFSLIISIVAIALVVALVAATMYHGGDVLTSGRNRADAAAFVTGAQQIAGAAQMFLSLEGSLPTSINGASDATSLVTKGYLATVPDIKGTWGTLAQHELDATVTSADVCTVLANQNSSAYSCASGAFKFNF